MKAMVPGNIQSGIRKAGMFPFSYNAIDKEKPFPSECFRETHSLQNVKAANLGKEL